MSLIFNSPDKTPEITPVRGFPGTPFRAAITGKPNTGKRSTALNILALCKNWPDQVCVVHPNKACALKEYGELADLIIDLDELATEPPVFEKERAGGGSAFNICVLDELGPWENLKKTHRAALERLHNYTSSHENVTILNLAQSYVGMGPLMRRSCNVIILCGAVHDRPELNQIAQRVGTDVADLEDLCSLFISRYDSLMINTDAPVEKRFRLNLTQLITKRG